MRGKAYLKWLGIALALVLMLMMGTTYYAQLSKGVEAARFIVGGKDTVRLKIWASLPQGTKIEVTIGQNKITFTWTANEVKQGFLDTGHLEIKGSEVFIKLLYDKPPNECRIPISQVPQGTYKAFCRLVTTFTINPLPNSRGWHNRDVTVSLKAEGGGPNLQICYRMEGAVQQSLNCVPHDSVELAIRREGQTTLFFYAKDVDLQEDEQKLEIKLDKTPPQISLIAEGDSNPYFGYYISRVSVTWNISDRLSGIADCAVEINGQRQASCQQGTQVLAIGSHNIKISAHDQADNEAYREASYEVKSPQPAFFRVFELTLDPAQPLINQLVHVRAKIQNIGDMKGEHSVWLEVDNEQIAGQERSLLLESREFKPVEFQFVVRSQEHLVEVKTPHDKAAQRVRAERFRVRVMRSQEPNAHGWNNRDVTVTIRVEGGGEGLQTCYRLEGATQQDLLCQSGNSASVTISNEGKTTIIYFAQDREAKSAEQSLDVKIDKTEPTISLKVEGTLNWRGEYYLSKVKIQWSVEDKVSALKSCRVEISGEPAVADCSGTKELLAYGEYRVFISAQDYADNEAKEEQTYRVEQPRPAFFEISNLTVTPSQLMMNTTAQISAQVQNVGDLEDEQPVWLEVNGKREGEQRLRLGPGESSSVSFGYTFSASGSYEIIIRSRDYSPKEPLRVNVESYLVCPSGCRYNSIQEAINREQPGSTILVAPGTYTESIVIQKPIALQGSGMGKTIVQAAEPGKPAIDITSSQTEIKFSEGFESGGLGSFRTGGNAPWSVQSQVRHSGSYAAQAGKIEDKQSSWLELQVSLDRDGIILFWVKTDSEFADKLTFFIDGEKQWPSWGGQRDWEQAQFNLSAGSHTLRWEYKKDYSVSEGQDTAWIDDISLIQPQPEQDVQVTLSDLTITGTRPWSEVETKLTCAGKDLTKSLIVDFCPDGVLIRGQAKVTLQNVEISDNARFGIVMVNSAQLMGSSLKVFKNRQGGLRLGDSSQATLQSSLITDNDGNGIEAWGSTTLEINGSTLRDNEGCGIWVFSDEVQASGGDNDMGGNGADLCGFAPATLRRPLASQASETQLSVPGNYATIQEAIDAIAPGGIITVAEGTHEVGLTVWKPVTLRGASRDRTILKALPERRLVVSVIAEASQVRLESLTLTGSKELGLLIYGQAELYNTQVSENKIGLNAMGQAQISVQRTTISDNKGIGIMVQSAAQLNLESSMISHNNGDGIQISSWPDVENPNLISNSTISNNDKTGVLIEGIAEVSGSTISGNGEDGLMIYGAAWVIDNSIYDNQGYGIYAWDEDQLIECRGNSLNRNGQGISGGYSEAALIRCFTPTSSFQITRIEGPQGCTPTLRVPWCTRVGRDYEVKVTVQNVTTLAPQMPCEFSSKPVRLYVDGSQQGEQMVTLRPSWFSTGGDTPWRVQSDVRYSGTYAAQAGSIGDNQSSWLEFRALVPYENWISFWVKVSSERYDDILTFYIDGEPRGSWSGQQDWEQAEFPVAAGPHTFRWEYKKDYSVSEGQDTAWIDDIEIPRLPLQDFESGGFGPASSLFQTGGDASWIVQNNTVHMGSYAAQAGRIRDNQSSWLELTLNIPTSSTISFWVKVSSESSYDKLIFFIDDSEQRSWSGEQDWRQESFSVSSGQHTFRWEYRKDGSNSMGQDSAWIDDIEISGVLSEGFESGSFSTGAGTGNEMVVIFPLRAPEYETTLTIEARTPDDECRGEPRCHTQLQVRRIPVAFDICCLTMTPRQGDLLYYKGYYVIPGNTRTTFTAEVTNTGDESGSRRIEFIIEERSDSGSLRQVYSTYTDVYLNRGEHTNVSFDYTFYDAGVYRITIRSPEDSTYTELAVWSTIACPSDCRYTSIQTYPSIQQAIDYAPSGGRVLILAGRYEEHLYIGKSLLLEGVSRDKVTVQRPSHYYGSMVEISGEATIAGITFDGDRQADNGIVVNRGSFLVIHDSYIGYNLHEGILVYGLAYIFNNTIAHNGGCGIRIIGDYFNVNPDVEELNSFYDNHGGNVCYH